MILNIKKKLTANRKIEIEQLADWITEEYNQNKGPIDLKELAKKNKIEIRDGYFNEAFDGHTIYHKGKYYIILNLSKCSLDSTERTRFTIAHEFGHFYIPEHNLHLRNKGIMSKNSSDSHQHNKVVEKEANYFAACLLMPRKWIVPDFLNTDMSLKNMANIAGTYQVSLSAILNRYALLGNIPIMIINSISGKIINHTFANCSPKFPHHRLIQQPNSELPPNTLACLLNTTGGCIGFQSHQLKVSDWFIPTNPTCRNHPLTELCYSQESSHHITSIIFLTNHNS